MESVTTLSKRISGFILLVERNSLPALGWNKKSDYGLQMCCSLLVSVCVKYICFTRKVVGICMFVGFFQSF